MWQSISSSKGTRLEYDSEPSSEYDSEPSSDSAKSATRLNLPLERPRFSEHVEDQAEPKEDQESKEQTEEPSDVPNDKDFLGCAHPPGDVGSDAKLAAARGFEQLEIRVPNEKVDLISGRGGNIIRHLLTRTRTLVEFKRRNPSDVGQSDEWFVRITGQKQHMGCARDMIQDILNQTARQSPLSREYVEQQANRLCGLIAPRRRYQCSTHHLKFCGYKYPQRPPYPSWNSQYPPSSNGNPPPVAPRSHAPEKAPAPSGPTEQTDPNPPYGSVPASAGYGQTYPKNPPAAASSGNGQPVAGSDQQPGDQQQQQAYPQAGYGLWPVPQPAVFADQQQPAANNAAAHGYQAGVDPAAYGAPPQQGPPSSFGNYLPLVALRNHFDPAQTSRQSSPSSHQQYSYAPSGPTHPNPLYGSAPASAGYGQTYPYDPPAAASSGYGQLVAGHSPQPGVQQQPQAYPQAGYGLYTVPQPALFAEQQQLAANNAASYGYQAPVFPAAFGAPPQRGPPAAAAYAAQPAPVSWYGGYSQQPFVQQQPQAYPQAGYGLYPVPHRAVFAEQQQSAANNAVAYGYQAPVFPAAFGAPPQWGPPAAACHVAAPYAAQPTRARFGNLAAVAPGAWYGGYGAQQQQQH